MTSVTDQLAADALRNQVARQMSGTPHARRFTGPWEQWLAKVAGPARAAKILGRKVCGVCQGKLKLHRVYSRPHEVERPGVLTTHVEYVCGRCGRTAA